MKRALMIASMASMLDNFNVSNIEILQKLGYEMTLAANFKTEDSNSPERVKQFRAEMEKKGCHVIHIDFTRKISNIKGQARSYGQVRKLTAGNYDLVHCHSPICAAITRLAFHKKRKKRLKVIYTAHGFHFYKGAPLINWLLYFPVECVCAHWTDTLITINQEDYQFAKKYLKAKRVEYIPGVGIDLQKFQDGTMDREVKRKSLGVGSEDFMLLSVGELIKRKNHEIVIKAVKGMNNPKIKYFICGIGLLEADIKAMIKEWGLEEQVHLLGYRRDISELCQAADLFVFPSLQEGLSVALMEAIAVKTSVICSDIRGNIDLIKDKKFLFNPYEEESVIQCIKTVLVLGTDMIMVKEQQYKLLKQFDLNFVLKKMMSFYESAANENKG